jgi:hypothetical protein
MNFSEVSGTTPELAHPESSNARAKGMYFKIYASRSGLKNLSTGPS